METRDNHNNFLSWTTSSHPQRVYKETTTNEGRHHQLFLEQKCFINKPPLLKGEIIIIITFKFFKKSMFVMFISLLKCGSFFMNILWTRRSCSRKVIIISSIFSEAVVSLWTICRQKEVVQEEKLLCFLSSQIWCFLNEPFADEKKLFKRSNY